jgi:hypothetical protein
VSEVPLSQTAAKPTRPSGDYEYEAPPVRHTSAWGGWVTFAGITVLLVSAVHVIAGLVALLDPEAYVVTSNGLVFEIDYTTWGWLHLGIGVVGMLTGVGLLNRRSWARVVGVVICSLSILANLAFAPAQPGWALTVIAMNVAFIYAIAVHGREPD